MKSDTSSEEPRPPESFVRFQEAVKRILTVSKKELNDRLATERAERAKKPQHKNS